MWNMNDVVSINYESGYIYHIEFDDGVTGNIDFSEYVTKGPIFARFKDKNFFKNATIEGVTVLLSLGQMVQILLLKHYTIKLYS